MWKYNQQPEGLRLIPSHGLTDAQELALRDYGWGLILRGEDDPLLLEQYAEHDLGLNLPEGNVEDMFEWLLDVRRAQQADWGDQPGQTTLSRAFAVLEQHNIIARENYLCCLDCASTEIVSEFDDSRTWIGAVYYHQQDTGDILEAGFTHLAYGIRLPAFFTSHEWSAMSGEQQAASYEELTIAMMKQVVIPILLEHGIDVDWSEQLEQRVRLSNVQFYARV